MKSIGIIEVSSIAKGIELCDHMIKAAEITVVEAMPMCPGKYVIIICGDVADVKHSVETASNEAGAALVDKLVIPNIHEQVFGAVNCTVHIDSIEALGIIETYSVASGIRSADTAVKAASIDLIEIRLSRGMGGKSYITLTGSVGAVKAAVTAGCEAAREEGLLAGYSVIPSPHSELKRFIY